MNLADLNRAIRVLLEELDKPALKPLPSLKYEYAEWKKVRVGLNYHVEIDGHFYSVPFTLAKQEIYVRYNSKMVEIFHKNNRVASHIRSSQKQGYTTVVAHMPKNHQKQAEWTPERLLNWAKKIGENTEKLIEAVIKSSSHPEKAFKSCLGIMRLGKSYGTVTFFLYFQK